MMLTYEKIFGCDDTYHEVLEKSGIAGEPVKADVAYATNLVDGVQKHIDKIDENNFGGGNRVDFGTNVKG